MDNKFVKNLLKILFILSFIATIFIQNFMFVSRTGNVTNIAVRTFVMYGDTANKQIRQKILYVQDVLGYIKQHKSIKKINEIKLDDKYFTKKEINHLRDVKKLFTGIAYIGYASLAILLLSFLYLFYFDRLRIVSIIFSCSLVTLLSLVLIVFFTYLDFDYFFSVLHMPFFKNKSWLFDESSFLIILFPVQFWTHIVKDFLANVFMQMIFITGLFLLVRRKYPVFRHSE